MNFLLSDGGWETLAETSGIIWDRLESPAYDLFELVKLFRWYILDNVIKPILKVNVSNIFLFSAQYIIYF